MTEIQLEQLRDIAIEYLPAAQEARDNFRQWNRLRKFTPRDYARDLWAKSRLIRGDVTLPALERAAANLLEAVAMWQAYDPNDPELADIDPTELREHSMRKIMDAADTLATITGRDMAHLMPADAPAAKLEAVRPGITKGAVISAFEGLHFDRSGWSNALSDVPKWIEACRVMRGRKGDKTASATWNPALIAAALIDKNIPLNKLDAVFVRLTDWADEWREVSASFRD